MVGGGATHTRLRGAAHLLEQGHLRAEVLKHIVVDPVELDGLHREPGQERGQPCQPLPSALTGGSRVGPPHRSPVPRLRTTCTAPLIPDPSSFSIS